MSATEIFWEILDQSMGIIIQKTTAFYLLSIQRKLYITKIRPSRRHFFQVILKLCRKQMLFMAGYKNRPPPVLHQLYNLIVRALEKQLVRAGTRGLKLESILHKPLVPALLFQVDGSVTYRLVPICYSAHSPKESALNSNYPRRTIQICQIGEFIVNQSS